jgi:hypothetical protein
LIFELNFVAKNSQKKFAKNWVCGRKNQLRPGRVHTWTNSTGYTSIFPPWTKGALKKKEKKKRNLISRSAFSDIPKKYWKKIK